MSSFPTSDSSPFSSSTQLLLQQPFPSPNVDALHSQMMMLHAQLSDYHIDSGLTPTLTPTSLPSSLPSSSTILSTPTNTAGSVNSTSTSTSSFSTSNLLLDKFNISDSDDKDNKDDDDDDIDALYHAIRQQKIQSININESSNPPIISFSGTMDIDILRQDNTYLRESLLEYKHKTNELQQQLTTSTNQLLDTHQQLHHYESLFQQAHHDNQLKQQQITDLNNNIVSLKTELTNRDTELKSVKQLFLETQDAVTAKNQLLLAITSNKNHTDDDDQPHSPIISPYQEQVHQLQGQLLDLQQDHHQLRTNINKITSDLRERYLSLCNLTSSTISNTTNQTNIHNNTPSNDNNYNNVYINQSIPTDTMPPSSPSSYNHQVLSDHSQIDSFTYKQQLMESKKMIHELQEQCQKLQDELNQVQSKSTITTNPTLTTSLSSSPTQLILDSNQPRISSNIPKNITHDEIDNKQLVEIDALKVHLLHMKSLLRQSNSNNPSHLLLTDTVTNLSLKLSYWAVLRDVYEETIEELLSMTQLDLTTIHPSSSTTSVSPLSVE